MQTPMEFANKYMEETLPLYQEYKTEAFVQAMRLIETAYMNEKTVFVCGNGGSAGTSNHMVNDLNKCPINEGKRRLKSLGLADNMSLFSAFANDNGYENVFVEQMKNLWTPGDVLIAISCSGNSPNVVKAAKFAVDNGGSAIGLIGFSGGKLKEICKPAIHFKSFNYGSVEDAQLMFSHLAGQYMYEFIKAKGPTKTFNE